jgi:SET domain-containing protein
MSKFVSKKISNIPDIGFGLFADENIKSGSFITEFQGTITNGSAKDNWSNIYFDNGKVLECFKDNLASFANDIIIFQKEKRNLVEVIKSGEPLYKSYNCEHPNAEIYTNHDKMRAWIRATRDINKGDEIFVHYGLPFWIKNEAIIHGGIGIPNDIFKSISFDKYVRMFYPEIIRIVPISKQVEGVYLLTDSNGGYYFDIHMLIGETYEKTAVY